MRRKFLLTVLVTCTSVQAKSETDLAEAAREAAARATAFFRNEVSTRGGYLWTYSLDLKTRAGEGRATDTQIWVQPPGTPSVGMAYLHTYEATRDRQYLDAAREAAEALVWGQLASGGWTNRIDFDPQGSKRWYYRRNLEAGDPKGRRQRNVSSFDDNQSQSALRLLMNVDKALNFQHQAIHDATDYALDFFLAAQYPNGAWPQGTDRPADQSLPVKKAHYPESWSRTPTGGDYWYYYTLNDNAMRDCVLTMLEAHEIYKREECLEAAKCAGDFLILAQMPEPQPAWAQQYNFDMEPAWARRFEPPAITGGESTGAIRTLVDLYLVTGEEKYLKPLPAAMDWYRRSRIDGARWARFYELRTNKPLYFTRTYKLVYTDDDLPTHYSFQGDYGVESALAYARRALREGREPLLAEREPIIDPKHHAARARHLAPRVRAVIDSLDERGRWAEEGQIRSRTFVNNLNLLADFLEEVRDAATSPE